jgi:hypothetical protein
MFYSTKANFSFIYFFERDLINSKSILGVDNVGEQLFVQEWTVSKHTLSIKNNIKIRTPFTYLVLWAKELHWLHWELTGRLGWICILKAGSRWQMLKDKQEAVMKASFDYFHLLFILFHNVCMYWQHLNDSCWQRVIIPHCYRLIKKLTTIQLVASEFFFFFFFFF